MKELDLSDEILHLASDDAYRAYGGEGTNPMFTEAFKAGFLFAKKIAIAAINQTREEQNDISPLVISREWWDSLNDLHQKSEANNMFNPNDEWVDLDTLNLTDERILILYKNYNGL